MCVWKRSMAGAIFAWSFVFIVNSSLLPSRKERREVDRVGGGKAKKRSAPFLFWDEAAKEVKAASSSVSQSISGRVAQASSCVFAFLSFNSFFEIWTLSCSTLKRFHFSLFTYCSCQKSSIECLAKRPFFIFYFFLEKSIILIQSCSWPRFGENIFFFFSFFFVLS